MPTGLTEQSTSELSQSESALGNQDQLIIPSALKHHRRALKRELTQARTLVEARLGLKVPTIKLYLSADTSAMKLLAQKHHGAVPPSWSAGLAFPRHRQVYLPVTTHAALPALLRHELAHIALGGGQMPLWVNEGVAVAIGEGLSFERLWTLNEAATTHSLHGFTELTRRFPEYGRPAQIAYAQSGHFIHYLTQAEGDEAFRRWIKALMQDESPQEAAKSAFLKSLNVHENQWSAKLQRGPLAWVALFAKSETLWALTIIIFVFLGRRKLKQRRNIQHIEQRVNLPTPRVMTAPSVSVAPHRRPTVRPSVRPSSHSSSHTSDESSLR